MYRETFAQKIKKAREKSGFTQREVSQETKISQSNLAKYETGTLEPDLEKLGILADFYGISIDWLLGTDGGRANAAYAPPPITTDNSLNQRL